MTSFRSLALSALLPLSIIAAAQNPPTAPTPPQAPGQGRGPGAPGGQTARPSQPRPYAEVVTKDAITSEGFFKVHQIDDKVLFEIAPDTMGRDLLWRSTISGAGPRGEFAGSPQGMSVVRFARRGNRVLLYAVDYGLRAEADDEGTRANIEANSVQTILGSYPVQTEGEKGTAVIDVTSLFLANPVEIGLTRTTPGGTDANRSFIEKVKAFPTNVEIDTTQTLTSPAAGASTVKVHYSMVALPERPMMGRLSDSRMGFIDTSFDTIGSDRNRRETKAYITRFRLEKKDPNAEISEPVEPIVWYISREVPEKWRPWVKKGIEDWGVAFEQAGFKNAIIAKMAPNPKDDPEWSPEDARYNVVRWSPSAVENAFAGPVTDPRSGETMQGVMVVFHDVMKLVSRLYFAQTGAVDPRASKLPLDDELTGELVRYVVAHEAGHALGLLHNWKASSHYSVAQLRDPKFTEENGVSASIMDYSRFNYVAQPGDGVKRLIGMVGPYDKFAIEWGYKPIPNVRRADDEKRILDAWLGRQVSDVRLRYWPEGDPIDAATQNEDIGSDPVAASRMGLKNLDRIASSTLLTGTTRFGEDYSLLAEARSTLMFQRTLELQHVTKLVGGVVGTDWHAGRGGAVYTPVPRAKQAEAVKFLVREGLVPIPSLYAAPLISRIQATGQTAEIANLQNTFLGALLQENRLQRLADNEAQNGAAAYSIAELLKDVTNGSFRDLATAKPKIDASERSLQRVYLRLMDGKVNPATPSNTDVKAYAIAALQRLARQVDLAQPKAADEATRVHLASVRRDIGLILNDRFAAPAAGSSSPASRGRALSHFHCGWPDKE
ncbi:MAG: zinc-dependent metalloprotease [Fimbriimonas sp.]